jgi:hypothetical protein
LLSLLGWRHRRHYDTRATFITIALEDGADREVIETRITHTKRSTSAFDLYNRGLQWTRTCEEISKLKVVRVRDREDNAFPMPIAANGGPVCSGESPILGAVLVQSEESFEMLPTSGLRRRVSNPRPGG